MKVEDLGNIPYQDALDIQLDRLQKVAGGQEEDTLLVCSHPAVVTLGRATEPGDVEDWDGELVEVQRGGRATFHGPNQIVVYPILDLKPRGNDLHKLLRNIEQAVMDTLKVYGLDARRCEGETGVWVGDKKLASIGIAVKKWVSYHGIALNLKNDFDQVGNFKPCGFSQDTMAGLQDFVDEPVSRKEVQQKLIESLKRCLAPFSKGIASI